MVADATSDRKTRRDIVLSPVLYNKNLPFLTVLDGFNCPCCICCDAKFNPEDSNCNVL